MRDFNRRLQAVESRLGGHEPPCGRGLDDLTRLKLLLIAVYLGDLHAGEAPIQGYARGLGYANARELDHDIRHDCAAAGERHAAAMQRLFTSRGLDPDIMTNTQFGEVVGALVEGIDPSLFARAGLGGGAAP
jgi:hypothetical protein